MTTVQTQFTAAEIARDNDFLRQYLDTFMKYPSRKRRVVLTTSVAESPNRDQILAAVQAFDVFTPDNDPYG